MLAEQARRRNLRLQMEQRSSSNLQPSINGNQSSLVLNASHPFHDLLTPSRYKVYYGGRDSGKSWAFAEALIRRATTQPIRVLCTREFQTSIKDSVHKLLSDTIHRLGLSAWFRITKDGIFSKAGAEFIFKGIRHNVDEVKSTEGIDICWVEEGQHTSENSWQILIPTIRKEGSEIWVSLNVTDEEAPTHKRFITQQPPGTIHHFVNYDKNPYLSTQSKAEIEYLRKIDIHAFEHVYGGLPKKISDAIIFGGKYVVEDFPDTLWEQAYRVHLGADFGFAQDPSTLIRFFIIDNTLYIEEEAWGVGVEFAGNSTPDGRGELEQFYDSVSGSRRWPIKADSARPETISFLRGCGFNIEAAEKWKGSVEDGIAHIKGFKKIVIHPRCKKTQEEARLYAYKRDRISNDILPIVVDKHNHVWDAVRYGLDGYIQQRGDLGIWARLGENA